MSCSSLRHKTKMAVSDISVAQSRSCSSLAFTSRIFTVEGTESSRSSVRTMPSILVSLRRDDATGMTSRICCLSSNQSKHPKPEACKPQGTGNQGPVHSKLHVRLGQQKGSVVSLSGDALSDKVTTSNIQRNQSICTGSQQCM